MQDLRTMGWVLAGERLSFGSRSLSVIVRILSEGFQKSMGPNIL